MNDFGGKLRLARERRGISLRQIATTTKISLGALEALERNDVSRLPGGIFTRSFVRSYATEVGLDPDATVHEFLERFQNVVVPAAPAPASAEAESTFDAHQRIASLVVKALLITVPLLVLILYFTMRVHTPVTVSSTPSVAAPTAAARPKPPAPPVSSATPVATSGASHAPMVDGDLVLEIATSDKCWVKVTTDGKVTVARLMQAGDQERLEVHDQALIRVGNAGAFTFAINGRPAKPLGPPGSIRTAVITKDTLARYTQ